MNLVNAQSEKRFPCILQISPNEWPDGGTKIVIDLHRSYRSRGYPSYMAVGQKNLDDKDVFLIPKKPASAWSYFWTQIEHRLVMLHHSNLAKIPATLASIKRLILKELGIEFFDFPGTYDILNLPPCFPDIVHAHNLHLDYFDLRALPWLSRQVPVFISMHDAWLLSGHCAHAIDCDRWKTGCGNCPDLQVYPSMKRDATAYNWRRKKQTYANSRLYITTASQWLKKKVEQSMLYPAVLETRVIPYGVDLTVFKPRYKREARLALNIPPDKPVLLVRAKSFEAKNNYWLDYRSARIVIDSILTQTKLPVTIIVLGADRPIKGFKRSAIRYVPYVKDQYTLAQYYQAADVFFHPARVDSFPLIILEMLASGTPVVATKVGGIPEQIVDGVTGFLASPGDIKFMIDQILRLLGDRELARLMGQRAALDASRRFDHERFVDDYLNWYQEILESRLYLLK
jgi:glycosyltransferase involved in cell wall biosynthesis